MENNVFDAEIDAPFVWNFFGSLPVGFLANALALTSPRDVGRLSMVDSVFRSAAEWDAVWERFLPPDYEQILAEAEGGTITSASKKELYLSLCDHPVIIDGGNKIFWLDKSSGKKCYMLAARHLSIIWGNTPEYWGWIPLAESRFAEAAKLLSVCWLDVNGRIDSSMLSIDICYVAYLVYKLTQSSYGFDDQPVEVSIGLSDVETQTENQTKTVFLDPGVYERQRQDSGQRRRRRMGMGCQSNVAPTVNGPNCRKDGWLEIELGEFFNETGLQGELKMSVMEVKHLNWKKGLIIQGIEIRPKANKL